jgi:hypothetical protein
VKELVRLREFEASTVTLSSMPSKYNAFPTLPVVHTGPLTEVAWFPLPDESHGFVPVPSSKFKYATRDAFGLCDGCRKDRIRRSRGDGSDAFGERK